ncbi:hypothetical protein GCM10023206_21570 [Acinetobacter puyangensis]|uniref:hypothetical protein n=1 Tax=Acinetobacter puyangensis TaxID=1096779 RepID=UPI000BE466C0|nr:hypothetical protein [Acinetobacter puyangensis]
MAKIKKISHNNLDLLWDIKIIHKTTILASLEQGHYFLNFSGGKYSEKCDLNKSAETTQRIATIRNKISCETKEIIRQTKAIIKNITYMESKIISIKDISNPRNTFLRLSCRV